MVKIQTEEIEIRGNWKMIGSEIKADDACQRIENLISDYLLEIKEDESGWNKLYQDPKDSRYWELSYPKSEMHGGGPPLLRYLSAAEAKEKFTL